MNKDRRAAEREAHIARVVAEAPAPSPEKIKELARLLLPSLLKQAEGRPPINHAA